MKAVSKKKKMTFDQFRDRFLPGKKSSPKGAEWNHDGKYYETLGRKIVDEACSDLKITLH